MGSKFNKITLPEMEVAWMVLWLLEVALVESDARLIKNSSF